MLEIKVGSTMRIVKNREERKADIVRAARHLFQTQEYDKTTMQDVMRVLGIAKGTIYHYFKSKEDLLAAVIEEIIEQSLEQIRTVLRESKGNALQRLKQLVKVSRLAEEHKNVLEALHKPGNDAMHTRLLALAIIKQAPLYAALIQEGCEEGIFKTETPLECAEFILSAIQFLTDMGIYPWAQEDLHRRTQAFPQFIERLLQAPDGSFRFLIEKMG
jgi:AcrR family transcriptional regulator